MTTDWTLVVTPRGIKFLGRKEADDYTSACWSDCVNRGEYPHVVISDDEPVAKPLEMWQIRGVVVYADGPGGITWEMKRFVTDYFGTGIPVFYRRLDQPEGHNRANEANSLGHLLDIDFYADVRKIGTETK